MHIQGMSIEVTGRLPGIGFLFGLFMSARNQTQIVRLCVIRALGAELSHCPSPSMFYFHAEQQDVAQFSLLS